MANNNFFTNILDRFAYNRLANRQFNSNTNQFVLPNGFSYESQKPSWVSMKSNLDFEMAYRENPIVKATINLLATAASNGEKVLVDSKTGEDISWDDKNPAVVQAKKLFNDRPNPLQSKREFAFQGTTYLKVFGNRYVNAVMPIGFDSRIDLMNVEAMYNLPSQFTEVRKTGKLYNQTELKGIIEKYARTNVSPVEYYDPEWILHFNEVNITSEFSTIMGVSKLAVLKDPIVNSFLCFQSIKTILESRGMVGIISPNTKDGMGASQPLAGTAKTEIHKAFKEDYGLLNGQNPYLISPIPLEFIRTILNSKELGIYEELSSNAILISNEFNVPPELVKTYIQGATYENQLQSVRRLYQDAAIPMVEDEDQYWNYRFNLDKYGFKLKTYWDHIPALADSFKEKAAALNLKGRTAKEVYNENGITLNEYREFLDLKPIQGGDVYKFEWDKDKINNDGNKTEANTEEN